MQNRAYYNYIETCISSFALILHRIPEQFSYYQQKYTFGETIDYIRSQLYVCLENKNLTFFTEAYLRYLCTTQYKSIYSYTLWFSQQRKSHLTPLWPFSSVEEPQMRKEFPG